MIHKTLKNRNKIRFDSSHNKNNKYSRNKTMKSRINTPYHNTNVQNSTNKIIIGVVHANWCGQCTILMPEWIKMTSELKNVNTIVVLSIEETDSQIEINKINNTYLKNSIEKLVVNGYPTIFKITNQGKLEYYNGNRTQKDLINWAHQPVNISIGGKKQTYRKKYRKSKYKSHL